MPESNITTARQYLERLEQFAPLEAFETILHPDFEVQIMPNLLDPHGSTRDLEMALAGTQQGRKILSEQHYDIRNAICSDDWVVLEYVWTGSLAVDLGPLEQGSQLRAHIATILRFQQGRIVQQRNYDCYEPLPS